MRGCTQIPLHCNDPCDRGIIAYSHDVSRICGACAANRTQCIQCNGIVAVFLRLFSSSLGVRCFFSLRFLEILVQELIGNILGLS